MPQLGEIQKDIDIGKLNGNKYSFKYIWLSCGVCGMQRWVKIVHNKPESSMCQSCAMTIFNKEKPKRGLNTGETHWHWTGGKIHKVEGYIEVWLSEDSPYYSMTTKSLKRSGYVYEHRLVMAIHLGMLLKDEEIVHHVNGVRDDNRIDNLALFASNSEHLHFHMEKRKTSIGRVKAYPDKMEAK